MNKWIYALIGVAGTAATAYTVYDKMNNGSFWWERLSSRSAQASKELEAKLQVIDQKLYRLEEKAKKDEPRSESKYLTS